MNSNTLQSNIEKYSSAFTLSDMEIFIFPDILYSLVLANIMSPIIWRWKNDPWFEDTDKKSFNYKINRVKQYIMERTVFNLDLETWGLTNKEKEIERFKDFIDINTLQQSNALFGYEGDKYYFKIDIRKHFGLDKYSSNIIPYWKTETVEAMMAFKQKKNYNIGAGECVSFSALYAAALFIIAKIPLEKIFMIATPLHSQNFIAEGEGMFTNNRRIVTKKMWYNGTEISQKARRAIEHEQITIVSHISGYIHNTYSHATINKDSYTLFSKKIKSFLSHEFSFEIFINILRQLPMYHILFQYQIQKIKPLYISMETIFEQEKASKNSFTNESRTALMAEINLKSTSNEPYKNSFLINDFEHFISKNNIPSTALAKDYLLKSASSNEQYNCITDIFTKIEEFIKTDPKLPSANKIYDNITPLKISPSMNRNDIISYLESMKEINPVADLAFYSYRKIDSIEQWYPFLMAAWQRNPVSLQGLENKTLEERYYILNEMNNQSIYEEHNRLAQPDEVWNFGTGDGLEKIILLANTLINNDSCDHFTISIKNNKATLIVNKTSFTFNTSFTI
ncbi:MAG: hypothetical protein J6V54_06760 [Bacteroidales bacterium]|nr:hypothetical protein [Bacteroidales bacterium]